MGKSTLTGELKQSNSDCDEANNQTQVKTSDQNLKLFSKVVEFDKPAETR